MIVTNDYKFGSNINEVTKTVLNVLFYFFLLFFLTKRFHKHKKAQNCLQQTKIKKCVYKHLRRKKLLIHIFAFCAFAWLYFYNVSAFSAFNAFSACKIFL